MSVELYGIQASQLAHVIRDETLAWGDRITDAGVARHTTIVEPGRVTVCVDDGHFVGRAAMLTRQLPFEESDGCHLGVHPPNRRRWCGPLTADFLDQAAAGRSRRQGSADDDGRPRDAPHQLGEQAVGDQEQDHVDGQGGEGGDVGGRAAPAHHREGAHQR
jgi:hypothetical protein